MDSDLTLVGGIYEYSGKARIGKSTLMIADCVLKLLNRSFLGAWAYVPSEVYSNLWFDIDGIHYHHSEDMLGVLTRARKERWVHKVYIVDECSQPPLFYARNTRDKLQTDLVTSLWQMPKLGCHMLYGSNLGNSVDIQQSHATWYSILPYKYIHGEIRCKDLIKFVVCNSRDLEKRKMVFHRPDIIQSIFNSFKPVI